MDQERQSSTSEWTIFDCYPPDKAHQQVSQVPERNETQKQTSELLYHSLWDQLKRHLLGCQHKGFAERTWNDLVEAFRGLEVGGRSVLYGRIWLRRTWRR